MAESTSSEIAGYHKVKRRFINLKDIDSEDPDLLQIYEFKGQDFDLVG
jgi:ribosomal protein L20A (L18A)